MIIDRKPEPYKDVKVHVLHKLTKKMSAGIAFWDGESWKLHASIWSAPMPIWFEVLGWEEK